jgi:hypothetical protein
VEILRNEIVADFQTICNMPGIWDRLRVALRRWDDVSIRAEAGHLERLL